jgi:uncharacterized Zn finger protein
MVKLRKGGHPVAPVTIAGRVIATTFWGRAWCDNIEGYHDYENRLPRGRTCVRNGSVVDLQIAPGRVTAVVSGSELYQVAITIKETVKTQWRAICTDCAGGINSLVELLQGRVSKSVMERLCRQQGGLFPRPADIRFSCSCPDHASMCKHVAAVLYGVGARLDQTPDLLFRLRAVDAADLLAGIDTAAVLSGKGPAEGRMLAADDVSALFGLDMAEPTKAAPDHSASGQASRAPPRKAVAVVKTVARASPSAKPDLAIGTSRKKTAPAKPTVPQKVAADAKGAPAKPPTRKPAARNAIAPSRSRAAAETSAIAAAIKAPAKRAKAAGPPEKVPVAGRRKSAAASTKARAEPKQRPVKWW